MPRTDARRRRAAVGFAAALALGVAAAAPAARGEDAGDADRIDALEERIAELEAAEDARAEAASAPWLPEWTERVRIGASASAGYFHRGDVSPADSDGFQVWDARLFVDAELARDVTLGGHVLVRNVGATVEWDLVRIGTLMNQVGELYVDFQGIGGSSWWNAQVGRFQLPVGESYLRYSRGYRDNPFVSNAVGGPWWWDEGVRLYGASPDGRLGYVASVSSGDTRFNTDANADPQATLKLFAEPFPWLRVSASGVVSGEIGSATAAAPGALWLGETWAMPIGAMSSVPVVVDGVVVPDGPTKLARTWLAGGDVVLRPVDGLRVWLAGGHYRIETAGAGPYDRSLVYWIAEAVAEGGLVSPALAPVYVGVRASGLTTGDRGRGYLLDFRMAETLGFDMYRLDEYAGVVGVRIGDHVRVRAEYTYQDVALVRGAAAAVASPRGDEHVFAIDVGIAF
ncbi:MAG: hypothetical protein R3E88_13275 [Myxococcota bacterium]